MEPGVVVHTCNSNYEPGVVVHTCNSNYEPGVVVHTCNSNYEPGVGGKTDPRLVQSKNARPYLKNY
jgi:hypothetical protein